MEAPIRKLQVIQQVRKEARRTNVCEPKFKATGKDESFVKALQIDPEQNERLALQRVA